MKSHTLFRSEMSISILSLACGVVCVPTSLLNGQDVTSAEVLKAIKDGQTYLTGQQKENGSWFAEPKGRGLTTFDTGITSLATLALIESGMKTKDTPVKKALDYLRTEVKAPDPDWTYEVALLLMALQAANEKERDLLRMRQLAEKLESVQRREGRFRGGWGYTISGQFSDRWVGDRSNTAYALQGLHAAAKVGIPVKRETWQRARQQWLDSQQADGGWNYTPEEGKYADTNSTGSMTLAGIISLTIISEHLRGFSTEENSGSPPKGINDPETDRAIAKAVAWMHKNYARGKNPNNSERILYYYVNLEQASRCCGSWFFNDHDWFQETANHLGQMKNRTRGSGAWEGIGPYESRPVIGTSFALLCLSRGLAPILIQHLSYGSVQAEQAGNVSNSNRSPHGVRRLTEHINGLPNWPRDVTWETRHLNHVVKSRQRKDQPLRAPILFLQGGDPHQFSEEEAEHLREYVNQGGTILATVDPTHEDSKEFEDSFRELMRLMYPKGECTLKPLPANHAAFNKEYQLSRDDFDVDGGNLNGRTAIYFCRENLSFYWSMIPGPKPSGGSEKLTRRVNQMSQFGVNIANVVTNRLPSSKLEARQHAQAKP